MKLVQEGLLMVMAAIKELVTVRPGLGIREAKLILAPIFAPC